MDRNPRPPNSKNIIGNEVRKKRKVTFKLVSKTGESRKEVGLRPGGMVMQEDLEIGSLAGDMSLYLAAPGPATAPAAAEGGWSELEKERSMGRHREVKEGREAGAEGSFYAVPAGFSLFRVIGREREEKRKRDREKWSVECDFS